MKESGEVMDGEQGFGEFEECEESVLQGVPVRECGEVMDGEQGFREFEESEESVCREFL